MNPKDPSPHAASPAPSTPRLAPVAPEARQPQLDMLRGWAVLGILAVNALAFAWPAVLEMDLSLAPFALAGDDKLGQWVVETFFAHKFRTLFSLLFGVSVFLVGGERGDADRGALLKRRLGWLAVIGAAHGAALWYGDILLHYALCGFIVMTVRSWPAGRLLAAGGGITAAWAVIVAGLAWTGAASGQASGPESLPFMPGPEQFAAMVEAYRSGWAGAASQNLIAWAIAAAMGLMLVPVTAPLMMLGLGLYKSGFLTGRAPGGLYAVLAGLGALALAFAGWAQWGALGSDSPVDKAWGDAAAAFAPLAMLGYVSGLLMIGRRGGWASRLLAPVGRMAFTNYLAQTLIMASLFYLPWGPMWFGRMGPAALWIPVTAVWAAQLVWSPLWLSVFRMGPLEWLWRCLTYRRWLPIRR